LKAPAAAFLEKSRATLARAEIMIEAGLHEDAGRAAYLAGYHAAQALIFEREGKVIKTHRGVHAEFARLARQESGFDAELRAFLGRAYQLKSVADYGTGSSAEVTPAQASQALAGALRFVEAVEALIGPSHEA